MATNVTVIGRTTRVRGRVSGDGDLQIEGLVIGEIVTSGNVTIDTHGARLCLLSLEGVIF